MTYEYDWRTITRWLWCFASRSISYLDNKVREDRYEHYEDAQIHNPQNVRHPMCLKLYLYSCWLTERVSSDQNFRIGSHLSARKRSTNRKFVISWDNAFKTSKYHKCFQIYQHISLLLFTIGKRRSWSSQDPVYGLMVLPLAWLSLNWAFSAERFKCVSSR